MPQAIFISTYNNIWLFKFPCSCWHEQGFSVSDHSQMTISLEGIRASGPHQDRSRVLCRSRELNMAKSAVLELEFAARLFAITIQTCVRGEGDPSRPFRTMIGLLDALASLDRVVELSWIAMCAVAVVGAAPAGAEVE